MDLSLFPFVLIWLKQYNAKLLGSSPKKELSELYTLFHISFPLLLSSIIVIDKRIKFYLFLIFFHALYLPSKFFASNSCLFSSSASIFPLYLPLQKVMTFLSLTSSISPCLIFFINDPRGIFIAPSILSSSNPIH